MKKLLLCFLISLSTSLVVRADLLDYFDFNSLTSGTATPASITGNSNIVTLDLSAFSVSSPIERTNFTGTTINTIGTDSSGGSLGIQNQTANGKSMIFSLSMSGYDDLIVSFATQGTSTGFNSGVWSWSTDNSFFTLLSGVNTASRTSFALQTVDFSGVSQIDNVSTVYLKYTLSGATSSSGNNRIDNIQFNATPTPEPSTIALGLVGGLAGLIALRRKS